MANPEHLELLNQGAKAWNGWRLQNTNTVPDLRGANLTDAKLDGFDFSRALLERANFLRASLDKADLEYATLMDSNFTEASLKASSLDSADLSNAYLLQAKLRACRFCGASLSWTNLSYSDLSEANFSNANMRSSQLWGANLSGAILHQAHLAAANFAYSTLNQTDFSDAWTQEVIFGHNDLSTSKGLETVEHQGPSIIDIDTIYKSRGNIPEIFLRGCGVPEDFIVYARSLVGKPIDFYSCFLSFSSKDDAFTKRLHSDLQDKNVRCWFAPEDLKIGDKFRARINESIRICDKLMVILSENSIRSQWVEEEVEAALEKERKQNKTVLFPITLDEAVVEADQAWAASLRRTRHIGDFRNWKDHDAYQESFERLLRDLKA